MPCWSKYSFFIQQIFFGPGSILEWFLDDRDPEVKVPSCDIYFREKTDISKQYNCYFPKKGSVTSILL